MDVSALRELKTLLDEGIITQEEFDQRKTEFLDAAVAASAAAAATDAAAQNPAEPLPPKPREKHRKTAAYLAMFVLGMFGVHKFYMGKIKEGIITLAITLILGVTIAAPACMLFLGILEGITYLNMSDEEWQNTYIKGSKAWF